MLMWDDTALFDSFIMGKIVNHVVDTFHSYLMDDDQFNEAMMRVALQVAEQYCKEAPCVTDEEDVYELAMELCTRVSVA